MAKVEKREIEMHFRVTPGEREQIRKRMEAAGGRRLATYVRDMALHGYIIHVDFSDMKELVRLLGIYGNNLNQYARYANQTGGVIARDVAELQLHLAELWLMVRKLMEQMLKLSDM